MNRFWIIFALIATASCSKVDPIDLSVVDSSEVISFELSAEAASTKTTLVESAADMVSVGIYCAYTAQSLWDDETTFEKMPNTQLTYNSATGAWDYEGDPITWGHTSGSDRFSFYGYSPFSSNDENSTNGIVSSIVDGELSIVYDVTTPVDLMIATPRKDILPPAGGNVTLSFGHALSAVRFNTTLQTGYEVSSIEIEGVSSSATMSYDYTDKSPSWGSHGEATAKFTLDNSDDLANEKSYLIVMPQEIPSTATVTLTTVNSSDSSDTSTYSFSFGESAKWLVGTIYNYSISVLSDNTIEFTVSVSSWGEVVDNEEFKFEDGTPDSTNNEE